MYYGSFPRKLEMFLEQLSLLIVITPTPPLPHSYKNAFPDGGIHVILSERKHSDKTHRTSLNALARGFGKEKKGNYHASKSDFR